MMSPTGIAYYPNPIISPLLVSPMYNNNGSVGNMYEYSGMFYPSPPSSPQSQGDASKRNRKKSSSFGHRSDSFLRSRSSSNDSLSASLDRFYTVLTNNETVGSNVTTPSSPSTNESKELGIGQDTTL